MSLVEMAVASVVPQTRRDPDNTYRLRESGTLKKVLALGRLELWRRKRAEVSASDEMSALFGNELAA